MADNSNSNTSAVNTIDNASTTANATNNANANSNGTNNANANLVSSQPKFLYIRGHVKYPGDDEGVVSIGEVLLEGVDEAECTGKDDKAYGGVPEAGLRCKVHAALLPTSDCRPDPESDDIDLDRVRDVTVSGMTADECASASGKYNASTEKCVVEACIANPGDITSATEPMNIFEQEVAVGLVIGGAVVLIIVIALIANALGGKAPPQEKRKTIEISI